MNTLPKLKNNSGQTLLVVVLVISVSLIVALSVISRSITDVTVTNKEEESQRAFSAAEAGIEKSLLSGSSITPTNLANASFTTQVGPFSQGTSSFVSPVPLNSGESMTVWFVSHNTDGSPHLNCGDAGFPCFSGTSINVCWDQDATAVASAVEVTVYHGSDLAHIEIYRTAVDSASPARGSFSSAAGSCTIGTNTFAHSQTITLPGQKIFARVKVLYNTTPVKIGIDGLSSAFPAQGIMVTSSGLAGAANRKISVFESYSEIPSIFELALFSPGGITK